MGGCIHEYMYIQSLLTIMIGMEQKVKEKLAPWEKKIAGAQSKLKVATAERDLMTQQQQDAQQRLKVELLSMLHPLIPTIHWLVRMGHITSL